MTKSSKNLRSSEISLSLSFWRRWAFKRGCRTYCYMLLETLMRISHRRNRLILRESQLSVSSSESKSTWDQLDTTAILLFFFATMGAVSTRKRSLGNKILNKVFNRIGSLHGSIYIVNPDLIISDPEFQEENKFKSLKISFSKLKIIKRYFRWLPC